MNKILSLIICARQIVVSTQQPKQKTYLDCAGGDVAVVGHAGSERGPIVKGEGGFVLRALELLVEGVNLIPVVQDTLFLSGEVGPLRHYNMRSDYESQRETFAL